MRLADYYSKYGRPGLNALAERAGTDPVYLYQIATGVRRAGWEMCHKLESASGGEISRFDERPDIFGSSSGSIPAQTVPAG